MIQTKSEDAVSPVIGVMLMLVVTIIIAAVVAAFAGGVGADAEPAPVTVLNVEGASAGHIETVPGKMEIIGGASAFRALSKYYTDENGNELNYLNPDGEWVEAYYDESGNAVAMPWIDEVPSVLLGWYGGSEAGRAIADVVFGDVNPSGRLPFTFPVKLEDNPAHYNGKTFPTRGKNHYDEGIFLGYRWHEKMDIKPLFAFGHGLSYTDFEYGDIRLSSKKIRNGKITVRVPVTNVGKVAGSEVVQVYVHDCEASVEMPQKQLKGFDKVYLEPGETKVVSIDLGPDAFRFFDEESMSWKTEPGDFEILVGSASDNIEKTVTVAL